MQALGSDFDVVWRYILGGSGRILQKLMEESPHRGLGVMELPKL
jgi:hypothetical protein